MKHLPENKKYRLAVYVLEGDSYAGAGRRYGIARQTAMDIAKSFFPKIFLSKEVDELNINFNKLSTLRSAWAAVCPF